MTRWTEDHLFQVGTVFKVKTGLDNLVLKFKAGLVTMGF